MDALGCNVDKKHLLDILAFLLWGENATLEVSPSDTRFMKKLYKEILADLKNQIAYRHNSPDDYEALNMKCRGRSGSGAPFSHSRRWYRLSDKVHSKASRNWNFSYLPSITCC